MNRHSIMLLSASLPWSQAFAKCTSRAARFQHHPPDPPSQGGKASLARDVIPSRVTRTRVSKSSLQLSQHQLCHHPSLALPEISFCRGLSSLVPLVDADQKRSAGIRRELSGNRNHLATGLNRLRPGRQNCLCRLLAGQPALAERQACRQENEIAHRAAGGGDGHHRPEIDEWLELAGTQGREADRHGQAGKDHARAGNLVAVEQALPETPLLALTVILHQAVES